MYIYIYYLKSSEFHIFSPVRCEKTPDLGPSRQVTPTVAAVTHVFQNSRRPRRRRNRSSRKSTAIRSPLRLRRGRRGTWRGFGVSPLGAMGAKLSNCLLGKSTMTGESITRKTLWLFNIAMENDP